MPTNLMTSDDIRWQPMTSEQRHVLSAVRDASPRRAETSQDIEIPLNRKVSGDDIMHWDGAFDRSEIDLRMAEDHVTCPGHWHGVRSILFEVTRSVLSVSTGLPEEQARVGQTDAEPDCIRDENGNHVELQKSVVSQASHGIF